MDLSLILNPRCSSKLRMKTSNTFLSLRRLPKSRMALSIATRFCAEICVCCVCACECVSVRVHVSVCVVCVHVSVCVVCVHVSVCECESACKHM